MDEPCLCAALRHATRVVSKLYGDRLAAAGVNAPQFAQLQAIARLGETTLGRLAQETDLDRSTLGRNARVLVQLGLARLGPGDDERTRVVALTSKGRRALEQGTPLWRGAQELVAERLGAARAAQLRRLLQDLAESAT